MKSLANTLNVTKAHKTPSPDVPINYYVKMQKVNATSRSQKLREFSTRRENVLQEMPKKVSSPKTK